MTTHVETAPNSTQARELNEHGMHISQSFTIDRPAAELYAFWRRLDNLPRFMENIESVAVHDQNRSHWKAKASAGKSLEWDAEIINDEPGHLIAWRSTDDSQLINAGSVRFTETGDRGTEVHVSLQYVPPGGALGKFVAQMFGKDPKASLREDLRRFKQLMESGELANPAGPRGTCGHSHSHDDPAEGDKG